MNLSALFLVLSLFLLVRAPPAGRIRYINSMSQFGKANVTAFAPPTTVFTSVSGGQLTAYSSLLPTKPWTFTSRFERNVTATSSRYSLTDNQWYSLYTYQTGPHQLANKLIEDWTPSMINDTANAYMRAVNLVQYNYPINVYNLSNNVLIFSNVSYGEASSYVPVLPGDYIVYWTSADDMRRGIHGSNVSGDPLLIAGKAYTYWVTPTGSFIMDDGIDMKKKREEPNDNLSSKFRIRRGVQRRSVVSVKVANENENEKQESKANLREENSGRKRERKLRRARK